MKQVERVLLSVYKEEGEEEGIKEFLLILRNYIFNKVVKVFILLRNPRQKRKRDDERECR